jgi:hypothetical protein
MPILRRNSILGIVLSLEKDFFGERLIFGKEDLILECVQHVERKKHEEKEGKIACRRKSNVARKQAILTMIGSGFFIRIIMAIRL